MVTEKKRNSLCWTASRTLVIKTPLRKPKTKNQRDLSLEGIYTASRRANLSVEIISDLILINRNSTPLGYNAPIDVFEVSLDDVENIVDDMEINPDDLADSNDTE